MASQQEMKLHALCIPTPLQGHINPMLKLAKILHSKGFDITFVNTEFNHQRLIRSQGHENLNGLPSFRFETIPDGLPPPENKDATQDIPSLAKSIVETCSGPFKSLVAKVSASYSPVTCIVADVLMGFTLDLAEELDIPEFLLWTSGTGSLICYDQFQNLLEKGLMPLKDTKVLFGKLAVTIESTSANPVIWMHTHRTTCQNPSFLVNGYLDTVIDCIPGMSGIRLKDIPPFIRKIYPGDEYMAQFLWSQVNISKTAPAIIFNTFNELEPDVFDTLSSMFPPCYSIGPLHLLEKTIEDNSLVSIKSNLWKEESECLTWLDSQAPVSVIYVNFGSIAVMTSQQLVEFCWGLADSNYPFLWIIRPDLVVGDSAMLPSEFITRTSGRGLLIGWCPQEQVLDHPSIGGFLTHSGWNSTLESISSGVPMICWPFFADQQVNCWLCCNKWGVAMEIDNDVKRDKVGKLVVESMTGEKGNALRKNATKWKKKAEAACVAKDGSSVANLEKLIHLMQTSSNK
ncbi:UDP-glucuronosyl/UDP-glucosyltransferase [Artemisia annua]|uniref:Glycosyltransferase n=1 Tax=Artemisia annua TaxID=35608 RepID=A0A2U1N1J7_ARTAN|nr:UDP-glucuronosyl/UDP-glucosyltransferase [Artemisia annua]